MCMDGVTIYVLEVQSFISLASHVGKWSAKNLFLSIVRGTMSQKTLIFWVKMGVWYI